MCEQQLDALQRIRRDILVHVHTDIHVRVHEHSDYTCAVAVPRILRPLRSLSSEPPLFCHFTGPGRFQPLNKIALVADVLYVVLFWNPFSFIEYFSPNKEKINRERYSRRHAREGRENRKVRIKMIIK